MIQLFPGKLQALAIILLHLIIDRRPGLLLGVDNWGLIILPAYIHQGVFLVDGVHVPVVVTFAETGATLWTFPVVVWLSNWLCSRLLWKPPWELPALVEIIDASLDDVDHEHEAEDAVHAESTVLNAAAPLSLPKDIERQLSKTELKKQVIVQFTWDPGGSEFLHRLGGKPKLKKGGMSGITHGWAFIWAVGLGLVEQCWTAWRHLQEGTGTAAKGHQSNYQQNISFLVVLFIFFL